MKTQLNFNEKMTVFSSETHAQSIGFAMKSLFLQVLETIEKSMPKGISKVVISESFSVLGVSFVDLLIVFEDFG